MERSTTNQINNLQKFLKFVYLIEVFVVGLLLIVFTLVSFGFMSIELKSYYFVIFSIMLFLLLIINLYEWFFGDSGTKKYKAITEMQQEAIENIELLNKELRSQRHDFLNHLQVIYSLLELEENEEAIKYLNNTYGDIMKLNANIKTKLVAVNALMQAKAHEAKKQNVEFNVHVKSNLSSIAMPEWELCRVMGNIIDNALYVLKTVKHPILTIEMSENIGVYDIRIRNNGPQIPEKIIDKIFESGFTTKVDNKDDHGMGLAIADTLLKQYHGKISVTSEEKWTCFRIVIPKEQNK